MNEPGQGSGQPLAITATGLVTSVGLGATSTCAAVRCGIDNFQETLFRDDMGEWIRAAEVPLSYHPSHKAKLTNLLNIAVAEVLEAHGDQARGIPVLLILPRPERPGNSVDVRQSLVDGLEIRFGAALHLQPEIIEQGKSGLAVALSLARQLIYGKGHPAVLVASVDSLLSEASLASLLADDRLLTTANSDGFLPGEAAAALIVTRPVTTDQRHTLIVGLGQSKESAHIGSGLPLRAEHLKRVIQFALGEARMSMHSVHFRVSDVSGEQYGFKEACLALQRVLHTPKPEMDLWHPADCIGEVGAPAGMVALIIADAAFKKNYAPGPTALCHVSDDAGDRAVFIVTQGSY